MADSPISVLKSGVEQWNQWRHKNHHKSCSLAGEDLSRGYFYEANFSGVDFSDANLSGACLIGANLQGAILTGANLTHAYVDNADLRKANLIGADLAGTNFQKADLRQALLPAAYDPAVYDQQSLPRTAQPVSHEASSQGAQGQGAQGAKVNSQNVDAGTAQAGITQIGAARTGVAIAEKASYPSSVSSIASSPLNDLSGEASNKLTKRLILWMPVSAIAVIAAVTVVSLFPNGILTPSFTAATTRETAADSVESAVEPGAALASDERAPDQIDKNALSERFEAGTSGADPLAKSSLNLVNALPGASQVWSVATHSRPDGQIWVMSGNADGQIKIWDGRTGETLHTLTEHTDTIRSLAVSSTGDRLVSSSGDGIKVWQPQTGELLYSLPPETGSPVWSVAISPDNRTFISGDYSGNITAWDLETGEQQYQTNVKVPVWSVAIAPDGQSFVSGSGDRTIRRWDLANGRLLQKFTGHQDAVRAVDISPDGKTIASGSWDNTIKLWNLESGALKTTLTGHSDRVISVAISPDGNTLASSSKDNTLKMWDIPSQQLTRTLDNSDNWVLTVAFDLKEGTLVSGGKDQTIKLWQ